MPKREAVFVSEMTKLIHDERLSPNIRNILVMIKMWVNMKPGPDRDLLKKVIEVQYGTPKRIRWTSPDDDEAAQLSNTNLEKEALSNLRNIWDDVLKEDDATVFNSTPGGS